MNAKTWKTAALGALLSALFLQGAPEAKQLMTAPQDDKTILGFDTWPGKAGALKPGLNFVPSSVGALAGFTVSSDKHKDLKAGDSKSLMRQVDLKKDAEGVRIQIQVSQQDTDDAQSALLGTVSARQAGVEGLKRGDQNGIAVGDLNFVTGRAGAPVFMIDFVRNNIRVQVAKSSEETTVDVVAVATAIDGQILAQPSFTKKTLKTQLPTITTLAPVSASVVPGGTTPMTLTATDPQGRPLQYVASAKKGTLQGDLTVSPPVLTFKAGDDVGTATINVLVYNSNLLFDVANTSITIAP